MYEIWLTLNILFELGLQYLPVVIGTALLWLILMAFAAGRRNAGWGKAIWPALAGQSLVGFGFAVPLLRPYLDQAARTVAAVGATSRVASLSARSETRVATLTPKRASSPRPCSA